MWRVVAVSFHSSQGSAGQSSTADPWSVIGSGSPCCSILPHFLELRSCLLARLPARRQCLYYDSRLTRLVVFVPRLEMLKERRRPARKRVASGATGVITPCFTKLVHAGDAHTLRVSGA